MPTSSKRLVRAFGPFTHGAESIVDLFTTLIRISLIGLRCRTLGIAPPGWVPFSWLLPYPGVNLTDGWASKDEVACGHDVSAVLRGRRERGRNSNIGADFP